MTSVFRPHPTLPLSMQVRNEGLKLTLFNIFLQLFNVAFIKALTFSKFFLQIVPFFIDSLWFVKLHADPEP